VTGNLYVLLPRKSLWHLHWTRIPNTERIMQSNYGIQLQWWALPNFLIFTGLSN
jgi:hypothetical protein